MKNLLKLRNVFVVLGLSLLAYGCGKDGSGSSSGNNATTPICQAGYIQSQYGCLPQSNGQLTCPAGSGIYNNQCVAGTIGGVGSCQGTCQPGQVQTQYGCYPQNSSCGACGALVNNYCYQGVAQTGGQPYPGGQYPGGQVGGGYPYQVYPYGGGGNYNYQYYYPYQNYSKCRYWGPFYYCSY